MCSAISTRAHHRILGQLPAVPLTKTFPLLPTWERPLLLQQREPGHAAAGPPKDTDTTGTQGGKWSFPGQLLLPLPYGIHEPGSAKGGFHPQTTAASTKFYYW